MMPYDQTLAAPLRQKHADLRALSDTLNDLAEQLLHREPQRIYSITTNSYELANATYPTGMARARLLAGYSLANQGRFNLAAHAFREAARLCETHGLEELKLPVQNGLAVAHMLSGEFAAAQKVLNLALEQTRQDQDPTHLARTLNNFGILFMMTANFKRALDYHTEAQKLEDQVNSTELQLTVALNVAYSLRQLGQLQEAGQLTQKQLGLARAAQLTHLEALALVSLAKTWGKMGALEAAEDTIDEALAVISRLGLLDARCAALILKARLMEQRGQGGEAVALLSEALTTAEELHLVVRCREAHEELALLHPSPALRMHHQLAAMIIQQAQKRQLKKQRRLGFDDRFGGESNLLPPQPMCAKPGGPPPEAVG